MTTGRYTYGTEHIELYEWGEGATVQIGAFCSIAKCKIFLGGNHCTDRISSYPFGHFHRHVFNTVDGTGQPYSNGNVIIGHDVWIGYNATIMSGITIGHGAVIANNAHVVKNVAPYTIVGGNPAKPLRQRFSNAVIDALLKIEWWHWPDEKINTHLPLMCSQRIEEFCAIHLKQV